MQVVEIENNREDIIMTYLEKAIKDGYAYITETGNKQKITYIASENHSENYNEPEEKIRAEFWAN